MSLQPEIAAQPAEPGRYRPKNKGMAAHIAACPIDLHQPSTETLRRAWAAAAAHRGEPIAVLTYPEFCHWERVLQAAHP